jgi:S1-C subfamily serine protease
MVKKITVSTTKILVLMSFIFSLAVLSPFLYRMALRGFLTSKVVKMEVHVNNRALGGGTGFYVKGKSGKTYILTNRHICDIPESAVLKLIPKSGKDKNRPIKAKIIEVSNKSDLCLIESPDNTNGLTVGDSLELGDLIHYAGYPRLQPLTMDTGEAVGYNFIGVFVGFIGEQVSEKQCKANKDMQIREIVAPFIKKTDSGNEDLFFIKRKVCIQFANSLVTTFTIYPGASGSPIVNWKGDLVSVVYAGPANGGWGWGVSLSQIKEFLLQR